MSIILNRFPLFTEKRTVFFQQHELIIKPHQLAVWMSISANANNPGNYLFPALIDTAFGYTCVLHAEQLHNWCRLHPDYDRIPIRLNSVDFSRAPNVHLWIYPSPAPTALEASLHRPIPLITKDIGIAVNTQNAGPASDPKGKIALRRFPRVPLLGMLALTQNHLRLFVDAWRSRFSLYQGRIWPWQRSIRNVAIAKRIIDFSLTKQLASSSISEACR